MTAQAGTVYWYVRADANDDISGDTFACSLDGTTWTTVTYVAPADWPPSVIAVDAATPPTDGRTGYWYQLLTGPSTSFEFQRGYNKLHGRCTDNPETPYFAWRIEVDPDA